MIKANKDFVSIEVEGIDTLLQDIESIADKSLVEAREGLIQIIRQDADIRFLTSPSTTVGGVVIGNVEWKKLSDYTFKLRPDRATGQLLLDSKTLRDTVVTPDYPGSSIELNGNNVTFVIDLPYADEVNKDRPYLFLHEDLLMKLQQYIINYYVNSK